MNRHPLEAMSPSAGQEMAAATVTPWPPVVGLVDPVNDARSWRLTAGAAAPDPGPVPALQETEGLVVARGKMVHLRTFTRGDLVYLSEWADDPRLEHLVGSDLLRMYADVYDRSPGFYDACLADPTQIVLMIVPNHAPARPVGMVRLYNIHLRDGYAGLEIIVADRAAWRRGFGVQAGRLVSFYGVDVLGLRRIESKVYAYNRVSINGLLRNGFTQEGVLRKAAYRDGQYWDIVLFGILKDEIEEQRRKDRYRLAADGQDGTAVEPP